MAGLFSWLTGKLPAEAVKTRKEKTDGTEVGAYTTLAVPGDAVALVDMKYSGEKKYNTNPYSPSVPHLGPGAPILYGALLSKTSDPEHPTFEVALDGGEKISFEAKHQYVFIPIVNQSGGKRRYARKSRRAGKKHRKTRGRK